MGHEERHLLPRPHPRTRKRSNVRYQDRYRMCQRHRAMHCDMQDRPRSLCQVPCWKLERCCPCVKKAIPKLPLTCPSVDQVSTSTTALAVTWTDCAPAGADAKITTLTPDTIVLGATTKFTGGGVLKKDLTGGTYTMTMTGIGGVSLLSCQGDASVAATCPIGLGPIKVGTATYGAVKFPVKAGDAVSLPDIVSVALPVGLPAFATKTITTLTVKDSAGTEAFCAQITTTPKDTDAVSPIVASEDSWVHV